MPYLEFYIKSRFCFSVKYVADGRIVGTGSAILHRDTAWLAHIIVEKEQRGNGIGTSITDALIRSIDQRQYKTILLIATELGEQVYKKLGFEKEMEYVYLIDGQTEFHKSDRIRPFDSSRTNAILELDKTVSGEERKGILEPHLENAQVIYKGEGVEGFYMPALGEGLIIADSPEAGIELMKLKYTQIKRAAIPAPNRPGLEFLVQSGFKERQRGSRMWLGKKLYWRPEKLFARIGGNLG